MVQVDFKTLLFAQSSTREQSSEKVWSELENEKRDWGETVFFSRLKRLDIDFEGKKTTVWSTEPEKRLVSSGSEVCKLAQVANH